MKLGYIGLGKMGKNMVLRLLEHHHTVVAWNRSKDSVAEVVKAGAQSAADLVEMVSKLERPRTIWIMLTAGKATEEMINKVAALLSPGDTVIDGANSFFKESQQRATELQKKGINFIDAGVSGGPGGARNGACLMVGGTVSNFKDHEQLFKDISAPDSYQFFEGYGAGHFTKMVHNGIEYGMMQAIAEGFAVLKKSEYSINLFDAASIYNKGSVIESRLIGWLHSGLEKEGAELSAISGSISHSGEGQWTVQTAKEMGIAVPIIEGSLQYRIDSQEKPSYIGKLVSLLRNQFGGHDVSKKK
jgi:6-phosphogluconate dehydrogenase